jgi:putative aminopeptidase FrvX
MSGAILETVQRLLEIPSPSGREEKFSALVCEMIEESGFQWTKDGAGNVSVPIPSQQENSPLTIMAAHMDEIGIVVTRLCEDGTLRVNPSGRLAPAKIGERPVTILGDNAEITGVISMGSGHRSDDHLCSVTWEDVCIITGLSIAELEKAGVRPGSTAVPVSEGRGIVTFGSDTNPLVGAWTFDDRTGAATLVELLRTIKKEKIVPQTPLMISFTVHEEGGCHGAKVLAHREKPEIFLAIDGCPITPGINLQLDERPGIWSKDREVHYDQRLVKFLRHCAKDAGTELQVAAYNSTASDASRVYATGAAPRVAVCGVVRENSHGFEVASKSAFANLLKILVKFIQSDPILPHPT